MPPEIETYYRATVTLFGTHCVCLGETTVRFSQEAFDKCNDDRPISLKEYAAWQVLRRADPLVCCDNDNDFVQPEHIVKLSVSKIEKV